MTRTESEVGRPTKFLDHAYGSAPSTRDETAFEMWARSHAQERVWGQRTKDIVKFAT